MGDQFTFLFIFSGIVIGIYDLFEMKADSMLHCNIFGSMDCTNLKLVGFTMSPPPAPTEPPQTPAASNKHYVILDYFPQAGMSFFFTFVIQGAALDQISMESNEPIHMDTMSPGCCATLPNGRCLAGTTDGTLLVWDVTTQKVLGSLYDRAMLEAVRDGKLIMQNPHVSGRPAHDGAITAVCVRTSGGSDTVAVSGGEMGRVKVWNLNTHQLMCSINAHKAAVSLKQFTIEMDYLIVCDPIRC